MLRLADPEKDYEHLVQLFNKVWSAPVSVEWLTNADERLGESPVFRRSVYRNDVGNIVGYSIALRMAHSADGRIFIDVIVDPEWRKQGIGSALYDDVLAHAHENGVTLLDAEVRDNCPDCLRFGEKRGFFLDRHMFESTVDLVGFDYGRLAHLVEQVEQTGIRFFSLADVGDTESERRKLYEVNRSCSLDDPASSGKFQSFEEFNKMLNTAKWFVPEGQILAADGDDYVGLSALGYISEQNGMYNNMTGVIRPYRGRKIAQALKIVALKFAKEYGAQTVRTNNDSQNHAMLAVNKKLGYVPQTGDYWLKNETP